MLNELSMNSSSRSEAVFLPISQEEDLPAAEKDMMSRIKAFITDHWKKILLMMMIAIGLIVTPVIGYLGYRIYHEDAGKDEMQYAPLHKEEHRLNVSEHVCPPIKSSSTGMKVKWIKDRVEFSCDIGYKLDGNTSIFCQTNGQWSAEVPHCVQEVTSTSTKPLTSLPLELDRCIFNLSQKMSPRTEYPFDCSEEKGLDDNGCLLVNGTCSSCQDILKLNGLVHIGKQSSFMTSITCCMKMIVCQKENWCGGEDMICEAWNGLPVCNTCPLGFTGDHCQESLPPAKVKCDRIDRKMASISPETPRCIESWLHNSYKNCVLDGKNDQSYVCETNQVTEENIPYCDLQ